VDLNLDLVCDLMLEIWSFRNASDLEYSRSLTMPMIAGPTDIRSLIARRVAQELRGGQVVNLGIGLPTLVKDFIPPGVEMLLQSENGMLGLGPAPPPDRVDPEITDAGGRPATILPGGAFFDTALSFAMIRGGHIDVSVLGCLQVDAAGNLANWMIPGQFVAGIGGGMDLATGARKIIVATEHNTKDGQPKIVARCTLPLTVVGRVSTIVSELAVLDVTPDGLRVREMADGVGWDELKRRSGVALLNTR
jgi:3-oxoacid CoA-transferase B subunit